MGPVDKIWRGRVVHAWSKQRGGPLPPDVPAFALEPARGRRPTPTPARQPRVAASSLATSSPLAITTSGSDAGGTPREPQRPREQQRPQQVGRHHGRATTGSLRRSCRRHLDRHAVDARVVDRRLDARRVVVERHHRIPAEPGRRDREHARPAAEVEKPAARRPARASARGTAAWSRGRRSRTPAPGRSRSRPPPQPPPPTAGGREPASSTSGRWNDRHRSSQSSATSDVRTSTSAPPPAAVRSGSAGSSPGAPYTAYSTTARADRHLLDPAGRQLEQLGEHDLGLLASDADREPEHEPRPTRRTRA